MKRHLLPVVPHQRHALEVVAALYHPLDLQRADDVAVAYFQPLHGHRAAGRQYQRGLQAARLGVGALTFTFVSPEEARQVVKDYYWTIENECEPIGYAVTPQIAIACPFLCDKDEKRM